MSTRNYSPQKIFIDLNKGFFKAANVLVILSLLLTGYAIYTINPTAIYYEIESGKSISHEFYMDAGQDLDIGLAIVHSNFREFNLEHDYEEPLLDIKLYRVTSDGNELIYTGKSAAWSRDYTADEGKYLLSVNNLSDETVGIVMGHGSITTLAVLAIVSASILFALGVTLLSTIFTLLIFAGMVLAVKQLIKMIDDLDQRQSKRVHMH